MSFRTVLILINVVAVVGAARASSRTASSACGGTRSRRSPRTSRRSSTTTCSRARTSSACSAVALIALVIVGRRAARLLHLGAVPRRPTPTTASTSASIERGAVLFANDAVRGVRQHEVAAVRRTATASTAAAAPRPSWSRATTRAATPTRRSTTSSPTSSPYCLPQQVAWAAPNLTARAAALRPRAAHADHHLRPAGHADARVGRRERQGRAQRAEHPRPRQLRREHPDHARQGPGGRGRRTLDEHARDARRAPRCEQRPTSGSPTPQAELAAAQADAADDAAPTRSQQPQHGVVEHAGEQLDGRARVAATQVAVRDRRRDPLPEQLRALPHAGLVVLRPDRSRGEPAAGAAWAAARSGPTSPTATSTDQFPPPDRRAELFDWIAVGVPANERVRHPRHLVGPHAALRRRAHQGADRGDHGLRAVAVGADVTRRSSPPRSSHKGLWYPTILGVLVVVAGGRALLRLDLPAARHQPRRPARLPRRVHRPHRASW